MNVLTEQGVGTGLGWNVFCMTMRVELGGMGKVTYQTSVFSRDGGKELPHDLLVLLFP